MKIVTLLLLAIFAGSGLVHGQGMVDPSKLTNEQLIDLLVEIDQQAPGLHGTASMSSFIAEDSQAKFTGGVLGSAPPAEFPQMKELVRRGVDALPDLLKHLDDPRPTKLTVGGGILMWSNWGEEYDPRVRELDEKGQLKRDIESREQRAANSRGNEVDYLVRVGDVCYGLVGQIVGRGLGAVRYQPTGGMIVNSPLERPILAEKTRADWAGCTREDLLKSLIADAKLQNPWLSTMAIPRLRYYFPEDFEQLKGGELMDKIAEYEKTQAEFEEQVRKSREAQEKSAKARAKNQ